MALFDSLMAGISPSAALRRGIRQQEQGDVKGAFARLSRAARSGIPEAEFRVGRCYLEGAGVPPSRADGVRWVERAATKGYVEAQALIATLCLHGMAPGDANTGSGLFGGQTMAEPDYPTAAKWARRAAEGGSAEGQAVLGFILTSGPENLRNPAEGDRWYQKSAAGGCPQGQLGYALILARDTSNPETQAELLKHLSQAAEKGLSTALYLYGMIQERGLNVPQDRAAAALCYKQAAEKGHRGAQARWGFALMSGNGVERNLVEGESWLRRAALAGDAEAAALVGDIYAKGGNLAAELRRGRDVVPPCRGRQSPRRRACPGHALSDRRRRAARPGRSRQTVPHCHAGRRRQFARRSRKSAAARPRRRTGFRSAPANGSSRRPNPATSSPRSISASVWPKASGSSATTARPPNGCAAPPTAWSTPSTWYGRMLVEGRGVPADPDEGRIWITKAAEVGMIEAQVMLADMMLSGRGGTKDHPAALALFEKAAGQGPCRRHVRDRRHVGWRPRRAMGPGRRPALVPHRRRTRPPLRTNDAGPLPGPQPRRRTEHRGSPTLDASVRSPRACRMPRPTSPLCPRLRIRTPLPPRGKNRFARRATD